MTDKKTQDTSARKRRLLALCRILLTAGLLAWLLCGIDFPKFLAVLDRASIPLLIALYLTFILAQSYGALRWWLLLRWYNDSVRFSAALRLTFISSFIGLFIPGGVGTDVVRVVGLGKSTADLAMAFSSVVIDRILSLLASALLVIVGLRFTSFQLDPALGKLAWIALAGIAVGVWAVFNPRMRQLLDKLMPGRLGALVSPRLAKIYRCLDLYRSQRALLAWGIVLAFGLQLIRIFITWLAAQALHVPAPFMDLVLFVPVITLLTMLPISFNGLGVREAGFVYFLAMSGIPSEQSFAVSLLLGVMVYLSAIPGAFLNAVKFKSDGAPATPTAPGPAGTIS